MKPYYITIPNAPPMFFATRARALSALYRYHGRRIEVTGPHRADHQHIVIDGGEARNFPTLDAAEEYRREHPGCGPAVARARKPRAAKDPVAGLQRKWTTRVTGPVLAAIRAIPGESDADKLKKLVECYALHGAGTRLSPVPTVDLEQLRSGVAGYDPATGECISVAASTVEWLARQTGHYATVEDVRAILRDTARA